MKKNTNIILKKNHSQLGQKGNIVKVASGYAFNYLIPNNFAELVTKGKLKHAKMLQSIQNKKVIEAKVYANEIQKQIEKISKISLYKTIGEKQQIFGSINEKEIANTIFNYTGQKIEKKQISLPNIKQLGIYIVDIQIFDNIRTHINLQILPQDCRIHI